MKHYPRILSIAGSDSGGGAGIQADLKTISALGGFGMTAVTAVTVQNTCGVRAIHAIPSDIIRGQILAVAGDIGMDAVKSGMLADAEAVHTVAACLKECGVRNFVMDPVMVATSGDRLTRGDTVKVLCTELIPLATVITPNLKEAEVLAGHEVRCVDDMVRTARELLRFGCRAVLIKGGHLDSDEMTDVLQMADTDAPYLFRGKQIASENVHGTGCTLSSAIATYLALGCGLPEAVEQAKHYITKAIEAGKDVTTGHGHGPVCHSWAPVPMQMTEA